MRRKHILPILLISASLTVPAYATDVNPANTAATETSVEENAEDSGNITETFQEDLTAESEPETTETSEAAETTGTAESVSNEELNGTAGVSIQTDESAVDVQQQAETEETVAIQDAETETEDEGGNITLIEPESALDEDGNVTLTMFTAENVILPVTVTMKGTEGSVEFTVQENGQQLKMKPDTYTLTKVVDGTGEKLDDGATLEITNEGGYVYLDFTAPEETGFQLSEFIISNLIFIPFLLLLYGGFRWFKKHYV